MKKHNSLEIIGFLLVGIGTLLWVSELSIKFNFLKPFQDYGEIMFWVGILIWSFGYMQKENMEKKSK